MLWFVSRTADPSRKPELLARILDHFLDKPLSSLSFRTLASSLGVSTYTLVYHFGTRRELIAEIVRAVSARQSVVEEKVAQSTDSLATYFDNLRASWEWTLDPRNRELQRLEFEGFLLESLEEDGSFTRSLYDNWQQIGQRALLRLGMGPADAAAQSRIMGDTFFGLRFDLVVTKDVERANAAFELALQSHRERIVRILGRAA